MSKQTLRNVLIVKLERNRNQEVRNVNSAKLENLATMLVLAARVVTLVSTRRVEQLMRRRVSSVDLAVTSSTQDKLHVSRAYQDCFKILPAKSRVISVRPTRKALIPTRTRANFAMKGDTLRLAAPTVQLAKLERTVPLLVKVA